MPIKKQEFYEGAALHQLARGGFITRLRYDPPFFVANDRVLMLLKYSTRSRSPWGFTFTPEEQQALEDRAVGFRTFVGLVCGGDGVAAFTYDSYRRIAARRPSPLHVSCYRRHREHYEVNGPDGTLDGKVAPSDWSKILDE